MFFQLDFPQKPRGGPQKENDHKMAALIKETNGKPADTNPAPVRNTGKSMAVPHFTLCHCFGVRRERGVGCYDGDDDKDEMEVGV